MPRHEPSGRAADEKSHASCVILAHRESEENVAEESEALTGLPTRVYMSQDFNCAGYQEGRNVLGTGVNGGTCWAHEKAGAGSKSKYSIGANNGEWILFSNTNCNPVIGAYVMSVGRATGTNPIESLYVDETPLAVKESMSSLPSCASGDIKKASTNGKSMAECWNRVQGGYSLASYDGDWYVFSGLDCARPSPVFCIGPANSPDPTDCAAAVMTYEYYSA